MQPEVIPWANVSNTLCRCQMDLSFIMGMSMTMHTIFLCPPVSILLVYCVNKVWPYCTTCCVPQGLRGLPGEQGFRGLPGAQVPTLNTSHSLTPPSLFHFIVQSVIHIYSTIVMVMGIAVIILFYTKSLAIAHKIGSRWRNKWNKVLLIVIVP